MTTHPQYNVSVPATSANLGPGYDSLGLALDWHNQFALSPAEEDTLLATADSPYALPSLSGDAARNNDLFRGLAAVYHQVGQPRPPFRVTATVNLPLARGLGSSATAIVGGLQLANQYLGHPLGVEALLALAFTLEGHGDNVGPALLGGVQACVANRCIALPWPTERWHLSVLVPETATVSTEASRQLFAPSLPRAQAIAHGQRYGQLLAAITLGDDTLLRHALQSDQWHEPQRGEALTGFFTLRQRLLQDPAVLGMVLSGSGPTVLVVHYPQWQPDVACWASTLWEGLAARHVPLWMGPDTP